MLSNPLLLENIDRDMNNKAQKMIKLKRIDKVNVDNNSSNGGFSGMF